MTLISTAIRTLEDTNIILVASTVMHYSNIHFGTKYKKAASISGTLWKLQKDKRIMKWHQFGFCYMGEEKSHGYSIPNKSSWCKITKVDKIIANLTPNDPTNIWFCFYCLEELTEENIAETYSEYGGFKFHICNNCRDKMLGKILEIKKEGLKYKKEHPEKFKWPPSY